MARKFRDDPPEPLPMPPAADEPVIIEETPTETPTARAAETPTPPEAAPPPAPVQRPVPSLGRVVHYTDERGVTHVAMITRGQPSDEVPIVVRVFPAWSDDYPIEARYDAEGKPGTWRWPPRLP